LGEGGSKLGGETVLAKSIFEKGSGEKNFIQAQGEGADHLIQRKRREGTGDNDCRVVALTNESGVDLFLLNQGGKKIPRAELKGKRRGRLFTGGRKSPTPTPLQGRNKGKSRKKPTTGSVQNGRKRNHSLSTKGHAVGRRKRMPVLGRGGGAIS